MGTKIMRQFKTEATWVPDVCLIRLLYLANRISYLGGASGLNYINRILDGLQSNGKTEAKCTSSERRNTLSHVNKGVNFLNLLSIGFMPKSL